MRSRGTRVCFVDFDTIRRQAAQCPPSRATPRRTAKKLRWYYRAAGERKTKTFRKIRFGCPERCQPFRDVSAVTAEGKRSQRLPAGYRPAVGVGVAFDQDFRSSPGP